MEFVFTGHSASAGHSGLGTLVKAARAVVLKASECFSGKLND